MRSQIAADATSCPPYELLKPFGALITAPRSGADIRELEVSQLTELVATHRLIVLRGFAPLEGQALPDFCRRFGELLEWEFGTVNDLRVQTEAQNYLYTNRAVPFHWDGAFVGRPPHYIFFECDDAPPTGSGGETLFCDTTRVLAQASANQLEIWKNIEITYTTEKIVHYGGTFTSAMITQHPITGAAVIRYAEPVNDLNPVHLDIAGVPENSHSDLIQDLNRRLNDQSNCYVHTWLTGDFLIADNYALLHGRRAFDGNARRHIRRVNVL
jgi:L-tyrosine isonitrile desaturase/decarboxylase